MSKELEPMKPIKRSLIPTVYGNVPGFLRSPIVRDPEGLKGFDFAVFGVPWEGTVTWGEQTGCELAPRTIRQASARYGGYIPEFDINILDHIKICDYGDVDVLWGNVDVTFERTRKKVKQILDSGAFPIALGGDHSITYPTLAAFGEHSDKKIGVIHFDSHFDNMDEYEGERYARCCPIRRISELHNIKRSSIVQIGIRGPRNAQAGAKYARESGARVFTIRDLRERGVEQTIEEAVKTARDGTDLVYMTICIDILDAAYAPGGALDPAGLTSYEMLNAVKKIGMNGLCGFDVVEVYPPSDHQNATSHLASWIVLYTLAGIVESR